MEILTIAIIVLLVGLALALAAYPLWQQSRPETLFKVTRSGQTLEEYQARYSAALVAIKDLMFDFEMGKITAEDYDILLTQAKLEAAQFRKNIDRLSRSDGQTPLDAALNQQIEALVAQTRQQTAGNHHVIPPEVNAEIELLKRIERIDAGGGCPNCGAAIQPNDAFCTRCGQSLAQTGAGFCPRCGSPAQPGDAFCTRCGGPLSVSVAPQNPRKSSA
ncbi:MAG: hypothetical protein FOGNACKC_02746 [Anaerolineae bacterium]|nr:hypothetical protein [Anaerolineae bacterium]